MFVKIVTLEYDERLSGFPQEALDRACASADVLEVRDHFFVHRGKPHIALVLIADERGGRGRPFSPEADPGKELPAELQPLYAALRRWRNETAKAEGVPAYVLFRNTQLAEVCRRVPRTIAALREIEGMGEATCARYGERLLAQIPAEQKPMPAKEAAP